LAQACGHVLHHPALHERAATRMPLRMACGGEPPWAITTTPFTPSNGAPP